MKVRTLLLAACLLSVPAHAFRIAERHDNFTKETYLVASDLKLCQVASAGFAAHCATLDLAWNPATPGLVGVRIEQIGIASVSEVAVNLGGKIERFGAGVPTDIDYDRSVSTLAGHLAWSSANAFLIPLSALRGIAEAPQNGVIRVSGVHSVTDYDFYRKATIRGVPADLLKQFLSSIDSR